MEWVIVAFAFDQRMFKWVTDWKYGLSTIAIESTHVRSVQGVDLCQWMSSFCTSAGSRRRGLTAGFRTRTVCLEV